MPFGTWRPPGRIRELKTNIVTFSALFIVIALLAGCGLVPLGDDHKKKSSSSTQNTQSGTPQTTQNNTQANTSQSNVGSLDPRDLASPPEPNDGITVELPPPVTAGNEMAQQDAFAQAGHFEPVPGGMLGSLGLNLESYFAENIQDPITRIKRLERALTAIQGDLKTVAPPIQRLIAVESDIQELVEQLEILLENEASAPTPAQPHAPPPQPYSPYNSPGTQAPAPLTQQQQQPQAQAPPPMAAQQQQPAYSPPPSTYTPPPAATGGPAVTSLRVGEHPGKVRLVLDVSGDTSYRADLDNNERLLVIELPGAVWSAARESTFGKTPILQSYRVESINGGQGSMLIMQLKQGSVITYQSKINALSGTGKRIVVDLGK